MVKPFSPEVVAEYRSAGAWSDQSLYQYLLSNAKSTPDAIALVDPPNRETFIAGAPQRLTWHELLDRVDSLAAALGKQGIGASDVVLVQLPNVWELVATYFAVARIGAIISPIAIQYRARELENAISLTAAKAYISTTNFKQFDHAAYFLERFPAFPGKVFVIEEQSPAGAESLRVLSDQFTTLEASELPQHKVDANSLLTVCWTSGTEGMPKGVPRTHNNWRASGIGVSDGYGIKGHETLLLPFPMINTAAIGGITLPWLLCGGKLVLHHPFDVAVFVQQLIDEKVTMTGVAPALLTTLLETPALRQQLQNACLTRVGVGSAPPSPKLMRDCQQQLGIAVINMFGSNEGFLLCSDQHIMPDPEQRARYFPRAGNAAFQWSNRGANWMRTKLIDPETRELIDEPGRPGELLFRGPSMFPGYYRNGEFDRKTFDDDGFFHTGDLFEIVADEHGPRFYRAVGRQKEIIIRGGFNISPVELDSVLVELAGVIEVAVAGYADERLGERICAYVVATPDADITLEKIGAFLKDKGLAQMKWPERLVFLEQLPRNVLGKVARRELGKTTATT